MRILFTQETPITNADDFTSFEYIEIRNKYFGNIYMPIIMIQLNEDKNANFTDLYSEENQLKYY